MYVYYIYLSIPLPTLPNQSFLCTENRGVRVESYMRLDLYRVECFSFPISFLSTSGSINTFYSVLSEYKGL